MPEYNYDFYWCLISAAVFNTCILLSHSPRSCHYNTFRTLAESQYTGDAQLT
jgi:hypothetical protein